MIFGMLYQKSNRVWKVREQDDLESVCIEEGASNRRLEKAA
jgi:hypothetical protein